MGAAPDIANFKFPKPAAACNFFLNTFFNPGIFKPIFSIALDSIADFRFEKTFS